MKSSTLELPPPFVSVPPTLDIFVVWHPKDEEGALICDTLFNHYHSTPFSGLPENAIEVYGRSCAHDTNNDFADTIPPIFTSDGTIGNINQRCIDNAAEYSVVLFFIGEHLVRSSLQTESEWHKYLTDAVKLQEHSGRNNSHTLVLPILPTNLPDYSNSPVITKLLNRQGVSQGCVGTYNYAHENRPAACEGALMRDVGQAIIQNLLADDGEQEKLRIFVSHSRADIPDSDLNDIYPHGVVAKVKAWADKTKLGHFIHDLQSGDPWDQKIREQVQSGAVLMIRTENYSNREWTQWEILEAKRFNTPVVCLDACTKTQFQGSFIFDNVPRVTYPSNEKHCDTRKVNDLQSRAIIEALNLLVDICLKQHIWNHLFASEKDSPTDTIWQHIDQNGELYGEEVHFFTHVPQSPEPALIPKIIGSLPFSRSTDKHIWVLHPDPPLLPAEQDMMTELCSLAGLDRSSIHFTTPHSLFLDATPITGKGARSDSISEVGVGGITLSISASYAENLHSFGLRCLHIGSAIDTITKSLLLVGGRITYAGQPGVCSPNIALSLLNAAERTLTLTRLKRQTPRLPNSAAPYSPTVVVNLTPPNLATPARESLNRDAQYSGSIASYGEVIASNMLACGHDARSTDIPNATSNENDPHHLTELRSSLPKLCDARLAISGKMLPISETNPDGYRGAMPGIIEESLYTLRAGKPLYVAGGFGGAGALLSDIINGTSTYANNSLFARHIYNNFKNVLDEIRDLYNPKLTGLSEHDIRRLAITQRPYEVAELLLKGLSSLRKEF
jgi:hypothetical protein